MLVGLRNDDALDIFHREAHEKELELIHLSYFSPRMMMPFPISVHMPGTLPWAKIWPHPCPCWNRTSGTRILLDWLIVIVDCESLSSEISNLLPVQSPSHWRLHLDLLWSRLVCLLIHNFSDRRRQLIEKWSFTFLEDGEHPPGNHELLIREVGMAHVISIHDAPPP